MNIKRRLKAFTILELLVVVAIIGILAVVGLVSYNSAKAKSRDSKRLADTDTIATAMMLYKEDMGTTAVTMADGHSTGSGGSGWFNYSNGGSDDSYDYSISDGLVSRGYLSADVTDPSGCTVTTSGSCNHGNAYMYYKTIGPYGTVYAVLEKPTDKMLDDCETDLGNFYCDYMTDNFYMNYFVRRQ